MEKKLKTKREALQKCIDHFWSGLRRWIYFRWEVKKKVDYAVISGSNISHLYPGWKLYNDEQPEDGAYIVLYTSQGEMELCKYDTSNDILKRLLRKNNTSWINAFPSVPPFFEKPIKK